MQIFEFSMFVFDSATGELTCDGRRRRIPNQAAQVLTILLAFAGQLVTREFIRDQLWPDEKYLDSSLSINRIVSDLRASLRTGRISGAQYIDTIPKRGYRFNAMVTQIERRNSQNQKVFADARQLGRDDRNRDHLVQVGTPANSDAMFRADLDASISAGAGITERRSENPGRRSTDTQRRTMSPC